LRNFRDRSLDPVGMHHARGTHTDQVAGLVADAGGVRGVAPEHSPVQPDRPDGSRRAPRISAESALDRVRGAFQRHTLLSTRDRTHLTRTPARARVWRVRLT